MILDGHIHVNRQDVDTEELNKRLSKAGIDGGLLISLRPQSFTQQARSYPNTIERLDNLIQWTYGNENLFPFFWIDPLEDDALSQVDMAVERGVMGFKVICNNFYPYDPIAMKVFKRIADVGKPILFHSGILWDGMPSGIYNRPSNFETLLMIDGLKFTLAHVSWPWYDENIAVYGKFLNAYSKRPDLSVEMFIDVTPGTPQIYREEVLTKLFTIGYDIDDNIIFGTDCNTNEYNVNWAKDWILRDNSIYDKLEISCETRKKIYSENLLRFVGVIDKKVEHKSLKSGE